MLDGDPLDPGSPVERRERHGHLNGRAIGTGDESLVVPEVLGVDLGNDQGHARVHAEIVAVVDDDGAALDGLPAELGRSAFFALGAREEGDLDAVEGAGATFFDLVLGRRRSPGAGRSGPTA